MQAYKGWSTDDVLRYVAASGGVISGVCTYILEKGLCDEIIQIGADENSPYAVRLYNSISKEDIMSCSASRYITGLTFKEFEKHIEHGKNMQLLVNRSI